jgi:hypothetical protein
MSVFTSKPRTDGFGAQFQNIIFDILYAHNNAHNTTKHKYVFPKITSFAHNYNNDPSFNQTLIDYMNLTPYFCIPKNVNYSNIPYCNPAVTYRYCETNLTQLLNSNTFKHIQHIFFENKTTPFNTAFYNVAVHVRRHNQHDDRVAGTNTSDNYYVNIIRFIRRRYNQTKPLKFHIYSQGSPSDFSIYAADDTEFHMNDTDVLETFSGLVFADSIITSGSSLSYTAALLNKGVIFYKRFWHKPANHWVIGDNIQA